jgi:BirA family biotin operon repressor/biotin-[acetyl-CoA-carboxylase] ligase
MASWLAIWRRDGFAPVREAWLARAARLGEAIRVRTGAESLEGIFAALDDEGCLVLNCAGGTRRISAGDVFLPVSS